METLALYTDFFYENEDVLYPKPEHLGGDKIIRQLVTAGRYGWEYFRHWLEFEKKNLEAEKVLKKSQGHLFH